MGSATARRYGASVIDEQGIRLGVEAMRRLVRLAYCEIAPGLSEEEFARIEQEYGFEFADDHRGFLASGLSGEAPPRRGCDLGQAVAGLA
jgi:hypothetical protein